MASALYEIIIGVKILTRCLNVSLLYSGDQPLLPLWGQICCTLMAEPTSATQPRSTGFINVQVTITD